MTEDKLDQPQSILLTLFKDSLFLEESCIQQLTLLKTLKHGKGEEKSALEKIKITKRKGLFLEFFLFD